MRTKLHNHRIVRVGANSVGYVYTSYIYENGSWYSETRTFKGYTRISIKKIFQNYWLRLINSGAL